MPINEWSDDIFIAEMSDEPTFSEEMATLMKRLEQRAKDPPHVIIDMKDVNYLNSSNIAQLLRLRQTLLNMKGKLRICAIKDPVWSMLLLTGLDKLFDFTDNVSTSLASLQIESDK